MIKNFLHFEEVSFLGIEHLRDPATLLSNLLLFFVGFWCYRRVAKFNNNVSPEVQISARGWSLFFLFGSIAYLFGVPVHGFSYYFPIKIHFGIWLVMGWFQNLAVVFVQLAFAQIYFPKQFKWIRPLVWIQFIGFCALMAYIRKFAAVNIDVALALVPIALWNISMHAKKRTPSSLIGWGILFAIIPAIVVVLKLMPSPWFNYNDIAHILLTGSLLIICRGVLNTFSSAEKSIA